MASAERLQLRLLIGADDVLVRAQPLALEHPRVEVQRAAGLRGEVGVAREDPRPRLPRLITSSCNQRQIVDADASVTPRSTTSRCSSTLEKRLSGSSYDSGNSHAIALTSATCCGGKTTRPTRPRLIAQSFKTMFGKSSSPTPDQTRRRVQPRSDLDVADTLRGIEHDPRTLHILKRQLLRPRRPLEHHALLLAELDPVTGRARHHPQIQRADPDPFT
jgi:hypothetical protein